MSDEKIASLMRDLVKLIEKRDVEKALSYFTEDGVWITPHGTFKGKEELRRYLTHFSLIHDMTITETGNGIIVQGNKAFFEHVISSTFEGKRIEGLAICAYEFSDDKIKEIRTVEDRLLMAKQAAKGWLAKWIVNSIVKRSEKHIR